MKGSFFFSPLWVLDRRINAKIARASLGYLQFSVRAARVGKTGPSPVTFSNQVGPRTRASNRECPALLDDQRDPCACLWWIALRV